MWLLSVTTAMCVSLVCAAWAAGCGWRAGQLTSEADGWLERGRAQAHGYAQSFDDSLARAQLESFAQRRDVLERAWLWQRGETLGLLFAVVAAAGAWVLGLLRRLQGSLDEVTREDRPSPAPRARLPTLRSVFSRSHS